MECYLRTMLYADQVKWLEKYGNELFDVIYSLGPGYYSFMEIARFVEILAPGQYSQSIYQLKVYVRLVIHNVITCFEVRDDIDPEEKAPFRIIGRSVEIL